MAEKLECPFCYGDVTIVSEEQASHSLPTCRVFDEADGADVFIARARTGDAYLHPAEPDEEEG